MSKRFLPLFVLAILLSAQLCFAQSISKDVVPAANTARCFAVGNVDLSSANEIAIGESESFMWYDGNFPQYRRALYVYRPGTGIVWYDTMYAGEGGVQAVCIGDVNNDGVNEIAVLNGSATDGGQAHLSIWAYSGGDIWTNVWDTTYSSQRFGERDLAIGDCDNDGQNELVVGFDWYGRCFRVYEHTGSNNFTESFNSGYISDVRSVQVADCDNDGNNEILVGTANWGTWDVRVYKWNGSAYALQWDSPTIGQMHAVCGDVDNDGLNEIVAASHGGDWHPDSVGIRVYRYNAGTYNLLWQSPKILACDVQIGNALNVSPSKNQILFSAVWWSDVASSFDTCSAGWGVYAWNGATFELKYFHQTEPNHWESWVGIADADNDGISEIISAPGQIVLYQASGWTGVSSGSITPTRDAALFLNQNYPNPTQSFTTIAYSIPNNGFVKLNIYNALGQVVKSAVNEAKKAGNYKFTWNGINNDGQRVASGTYLYSLEVDGKATTKKMMILK